ncbi:hypothetical protein ACIOWI_33315 [Streptomyces sp. NPDC087659]|uniref:hypothetical protein n=1 Tax=Streptomyces sp. NPDC087659 TaxID=3365801 RepID=UPI003803E764
MGGQQPTVDGRAADLQAACCFRARVDDLLQVADGYAGVGEARLAARSVFVDRAHPRAVLGVNPCEAHRTS